MSAESLSDLTNDEYLIVLLGKNQKWQK
jgi:hypothetical protein